MCKYTRYYLLPSITIIMGSDGSKYRITKTLNKSSPWRGFCVIVTINEIKEELVLPNGEKHKFVFNNKGLQILEGAHKGCYKIENVY